MLGRNKRSLPEGGGETPLKSESPLSSPAASVLRRVVAPLTREREGLGPRGASAACQTHNCSQFGQPALPTLLADNSRRRPPRMNRPIHGGAGVQRPAGRDGFGVTSASPLQRGVTLPPAAGSGNKCRHACRAGGGTNCAGVVPCSSNVRVKHVHPRCCCSAVSMGGASFVPGRRGGRFICVAERVCLVCVCVSLWQRAPLDLGQC